MTHPSWEAKNCMTHVIEAENSDPPLPSYLFTGPLYMYIGGLLKNL